MRKTAPAVACAAAAIRRPSSTPSQRTRSLPTRDLPFLLAACSQRFLYSMQIYNATILLCVAFIHVWYSKNNIYIDSMLPTTNSRVLLWNAWSTTLPKVRYSIYAYIAARKPYRIFCEARIFIVVRLPCVTTRNSVSAGAAVYNCCSVWSNWANPCSFLPDALLCSTVLSLR